MRGSITDQDRDFVETWENIAAQQNAIIRLDTRGDERQEVIVGRRTFMLTSQERLITEDRVFDQKNDPFRNGDFRPVTVPDTINIQSNPNALSDEEITRICRSSDIAWQEWMATIDSVATLRRMLDLADELEDLTLRRYRQIEDRLLEVRPQTRLISKDDQLNKFLEEGRRQRPPEDQETPSETPGKPASKRRRGGMSADYR